MSSLTIKKSILPYLSIYWHRKYLYNFVHFVTLKKIYELSNQNIKPMASVKNELMSRYF